MGFHESLSALRTLLANTPEFRAWLGVDSVADAEPLIFLSIKPSDAEAPEKFALIAYGDGQFSRERSGQGAGAGNFSGNDSLFLIFEQQTPDIYTAAEQFSADISRIIDGLLDVSGLVPGGTYVQGVSNVGAMVSGDNQTEPQVLTAQFSVHWGLQ